MKEGINKLDEELMVKFLMGECSEEELHKVNTWLDESGGRFNIQDYKGDCTGECLYVFQPDLSCTGSFALPGGGVQGSDISSGDHCQYVDRNYSGNPGEKGTG